MSINNPELGACFFKYRGGIWAVLMLAMLYFAVPTLWGWIFGLPVVILGQIARIWAAGTIKKYRGEMVGGAELVTWGPYSITRNPLYLGNFMIGLGWGIISSSPIAVAIFIAMFYVVYLKFIIPYEESYLARKFGEVYKNFLTSTPALLPRLGKKVKLGPFDWSIIAVSETHSIAVTVIGTGLLAVKDFWAA